MAKEIGMFTAPELGKASFLQESVGAVSSAVRLNIQDGFAVYLSHLDRLPQPVILGILDDTQSINPQIAIAELSRYHYSIPQRPGEGMEGNTLRERFQVSYCCGKTLGKAPSITQRDKLSSSAFANAQEGLLTPIARTDIENSVRKLNGVVNLTVGMMSLTM